MTINGQRKLNKLKPVLLYFEKFFFSVDAYFFLIQVLLLYNSVLVSGVNQCEPGTHKHVTFFQVLFHCSVHKMLSIVPCAMQQDPVAYLFYVQ